LVAALLLALLGAGLLVGRAVVRTNYYVTAYGGTVAIMRGVQGSILGVPLQEPYLLGCLDSKGELVQISFSQSGDKLSCRLMTLQDLRPPARQQVSNGLPAGTLDDAITQLRNLARDSLLPPCPHGTTAGTSSTPSRTPAPGLVPTGPRPGPPPPPTSGKSRLPTLTNLPPAPPEPGTDCRAAS
ncbi:MAG: serine/threonine protein phosphatase, partial [Mycobacterium sp.]